VTPVTRDLQMLWRQVRHELVVLTRTPIVMILAVAFPLAFFALIAAFVGNETIDARSGIRVAQFLAPAFASFGVVMSTFSFLGIGLAEARAAGVVKRQTGTPLPRWAMIGGRMGAALILGLTATALVIGAGVAFYDVQIIGRTLAAVLVTIVVASLSFSALGIAVAAVAPSPQVAQALTNGIVIPLAFVSDIFTFGGGDVPRWLDTLGWVFPLKHLVNALGDAFNPFLEGNGFALDHLAVIAAWGVAGALAAAWLLRASRERSTGDPKSAGRGSRGDAAPRRTGRPGAVSLTADQVRHTATGLRRDFSAVFFSALFPVALVILVPAMNGAGDVVLDNGVTLVAFYTATMAIYGASVTGYVSIAEGVAESRSHGVLKRAHGTPLPLWTMLGGRIVGGVAISLLTLLGCYAAAGLVFGSPIPDRWWAVILVLVVASVCFTSLGLAVVSLVRSGQGVIGITLGTLLPLSFISDVFVVGAEYPPLMDRIGWFFPLRHATRAVTHAAAPSDLPVSGLDLDHLAVVLAWTVAALAVVAWRFDWEGRAPATKVAKGAKVQATVSDG
jgi:ABC-2 type transport system permease protein